MTLNFPWCSIAIIRGFFSHIGSNLGSSTFENKALLDFPNKEFEKVMGFGVTNADQTIVFTKYLYCSRTLTNRPKLNQ